ncbi:MAG: hypothetical protein K5746_07110 [Clostridiales bacterium]|nr:hypothetical protein [Clostridiales bacterium]
MKKLAVLFLASLLLLATASAETPDAVASASVNSFYGGMTGDDLMNAINSYTGFYSISSVNPDGTPNVAFFIYGMAKAGDKYYVQLGISPNQTTANIENGSALMAMYAAIPAEGATYPTTGARMLLKKVEDEALIAELLKNAPEGYTPMYYEVTETRPLG